MGFVGSSKWKEYLATSEGRLDQALAPATLRDLTREDYAELLSLCSGAANPEEEAAALEFLSDLLCFAPLSPEAQRTLRHSLAGATAQLLSVLNRHVPDKRALTAALLLDQSAPAALGQYLVDEAPPALLAGLNERDLRRWLEHLSDVARAHLTTGGNPSPASAGAVNKLYEIVRQGGLLAKVAAEELWGKKLAVHQTIQPLVRQQKEVSLQDAQALCECMEEPVFGVTREVLREQAESWLQQRSGGALDFLYQKCISRLREGVPIKAILAVLGNPSAVCYNTFWYSTKAESGRTAEVVLHQSRNGEFLPNGVPASSRRDGASLLESEAWTQAMGSGRAILRPLRDQVSSADVAPLIDFLATAAVDQKRIALTVLHWAILKKIEMNEAEKQRLLAILDSLSKDAHEVGRDALTVMRRLIGQMDQSLPPEAVGLSAMPEVQFRRRLNEMTDDGSATAMDHLAQYAKLEGKWGQQAARRLKLMGLIEKNEVEEIAARWKESGSLEALNDLYEFHIEHHLFGKPIEWLLELLGPPEVHCFDSCCYNSKRGAGWLFFIEDGKLVSSKDVDGG